MYKLLNTFTLTIIIFSSSACAMASDRSRVVEEAAIYSTLINENPVGYIDGSPIIILAETSYEELAENEYVKRIAPALSEETLENYHLVNKDPQIIDVPLCLNTEYKYIGNAEWKTLVNLYDWTEFNKKY